MIITFRKFIFLSLLLGPIYANASIVVDGKLDEVEWQQAQSIDDLTIINPFSLETPDYQTKVLIHSDESGIYFGFINQQPNETRDRRRHCLLYTSDAADDSLRVDLGGRRII